MPRETKRSRTSSNTSRCSIIGGADTRPSAMTPQPSTKRGQRLLNQVSTELGEGQLSNSSSGAPPSSKLYRSHRLITTWTKENICLYFFLYIFFTDIQLLSSTATHERSPPLFSLSFLGGLTVSRATLPKEQDLVQAQPGRHAETD